GATGEQRGNLAAEALSQMWSALARLLLRRAPPGGVAGEAEPVITKSSVTGAAPEDHAARRRPVSSVRRDRESAGASRARRSGGRAARRAQPRHLVRRLPPPTARALARRAT